MAWVFAAWGVTNLIGCNQEPHTGGPRKLTTVTLVRVDRTREKPQTRVER